MTMPSYAATSVTARLHEANDNSDVAIPSSIKSPGMRAGSLRLSRMVTATFLIVGDVISYLIAYSFMSMLLPFSSYGTLLERIFALAALTVMTLYFSASLYPGYRLHAHEHLRRRTKASLKVAALVALGVAFLPDSAGLLLATIAFISLGLIFQPIAHWIMRRLSRRIGLWGERSVIIAPSNRTPELIEYFTNHWQYGIRPEPFSPDMLSSSPRGRASIALIADDKGPFIAELTSMRRTFGEVILLSDTPNFKITGLRPADVGGEIGVRLASGERLANSSLFRRALDLAIAIPLALIAAPFILIAAAAIYAIDPGPVFFRHTREGFAGKPIRVLKLRTMFRDAEQRLEALFREDPAIKAEWSTHFKLKRDPRILPVIGQLVRSTSLDELPQLLNIIAGEMAIVGPRPFPDYHLRAMDGEFRNKRRSVTPGLTGLWQVSARSNADIVLQQQLDEFYIDNRSMWLDWHILLSTLPAVFKREGAC